MNRSSIAGRQPSRESAGVAGHFRIHVMVLIAAILCAAIAAVWLRPAKISLTPSEPPVHREPIAEAEAPQPLTISRAATAERVESLERPSAVPVPSAPPVIAVPAAFPEASPATRLLVNNLVRLEGNITPQQGTAWKSNFQELIKQGTAAVPAIREFLARNQDASFGAGGSSVLGYGSARTAMFDALAQIGGPEASSALNGVLQTTGDPREIALLAEHLDKLEPGQHQQEILAAAREAIAMASAGKLPNRDAGPLFEVLQKFGDASVVEDLQQNARHWDHYSMFALAQLPEDAGIPALLQIASGQDLMKQEVRTAALEMLAQVAPQTDVARTALIDLARQNQISATNWTALQPFLAGAQFHFDDYMRSTSERSDAQTVPLASNYQSFSIVPTPESLVPERLNQQMVLVDQLLSVTSDPTGIQTLQQAKVLLSTRLAKATDTKP